MSSGSTSGVSSRTASAEDSTGYVVLDTAKMISDERLQTQKSLKNIFQRIALFRYEDARSAVNQALDSTSKQSGNTVGSSSILAQLKPIILTLIDKERDSVQLERRNNKSQFIKNIAHIGQNIATGRNYPTSMDRLKADLESLVRESGSGTQNDVTELVRTVAGELDIYVNARFTKLHDQIVMDLCRIGDAPTRHSFCKDNLKTVQKVKDEASKMQSDALSPLRSMLVYEGTVTEQLFLCTLSLSRWDFVSSLLHLQSFRTSYTEWIERFKKTERDLMGSRKNLKDDEFPELYKWFYKVYEVLLSKFTLYFSKTLLENSNRRTLKGSLASIVDYKSKLAEFQKKTKAATLSLILNLSTLDQPFLGHGFKFLTEEPRELAGSYTDKFEVILHCGGKELEGETKMEIVHLYSDVFHKNGKPYLYDEKRNRSYFLSLFDLNIFLAVSYNTRKGEKDSEINKFIDDFRNSMNMSRL